jgi:hypothetical protein
VSAFCWLTKLTVHEGRRIFTAVHEQTSKVRNIAGVQNSSVHRGDIRNMGIAQVARFRSPTQFANLTGEWIKGRQQAVL